MTTEAEPAKKHFKLWQSHEPRGDTLGDLEIKRTNGKTTIYRNVKHLHDDTEGISFYYQHSEGAWGMLRVPFEKIESYRIV
jgi:hypothetical protein